MAGGASEENPVGINVTAMVDIIFCLVLFFMCSLKFKELEGKMDSWLPKDKGANAGKPLNTPQDEIRVLLSWNKATQSLDRLFGRRPIPYTDEGNIMLQTLIREEYNNQRKSGNPDAPVIIDSGPAVPWEEVVRIMNMARAENIPKVEFAMGTQIKEGG